MCCLNVAACSVNLNPATVQEMVNLVWFSLRSRCARLEHIDLSRYRSAGLLPGNGAHCIANFVY